MIPEFQFYYSSINSLLSLITRNLHPTFQFYYSSINRDVKSRYIQSPSDFNSTIVQLIAPTENLTSCPSPNFNSTIVQLIVLI